MGTTVGRKVCLRKASTWIATQSCTNQIKPPRVITILESSIPRRGAGFVSCLTNQLRQYERQGTYQRHRHCTGRVGAVSPPNLVVTSETETEGTEGLVSQEFRVVSGRVWASLGSALVARRLYSWQRSWLCSWLCSWLYSWLYSLARSGPHKFKLQRPSVI